MDKIMLCTNWWGGLGDIILYLSAANEYCRRHKTILNIGCCNDNIENKSIRLIELYNKYNEILFNFVYRRDFTNSGVEDNDKYEIYGNDNYVRSVREVCYVPRRQIYGTYSILRVGGKLHDIPDFEVQYLKYNKKQNSNIITLQLDGRSSGGLENYYINFNDIIEIIKNNKEYLFYIFSDVIVDSRLIEYKNVKVIKTSNESLNMIYDIINNSVCHIGVDSGLCHVAMSCRTPYIGLKKRIIINGLVNGFEDSVILPASTHHEIQTYLNTIKK